jgi:hypothetical protein
MTQTEMLIDLTVAAPTLFIYGVLAVRRERKLTLDDLLFLGFSIGAGLTGAAMVIKAFIHTPSGEEQTGWLMGLFGAALFVAFATKVYYTFRAILSNASKENGEPDAPA